MPDRVNRGYKPLPQSIVANMNLQSFFGDVGDLRGGLEDLQAQRFKLVIFAFQQILLGKADQLIVDIVLLFIVYYLN